MDKNFGGVIWTNHAIERLKERKISQGDAFAAFNRPDESKYSRKSAGYVYYKSWGNQKLEVVAKKNGEGKWVIISVWSKPLHRGVSQKPTFLIGLFKKMFS